MLKQNGPSTAVQFSAVSCFIAVCTVFMCLNQGVTKRCRLSLLTNSALVYELKCGGKGGGVAGPQPMSTAVHMEPNKLWRFNL
jgi:hypothetical protein